MVLAGIQKDDVVAVSKNGGPHFFAEVTAPVATSKYVPQPHITFVPIGQSGNGWRTATAREVKGHWKATAATKRMRRV